jgi:competence protein ComEC
MGELPLSNPRVLRRVAWMGLLALCCVHVAAAWIQARNATIPQCAAGVDLPITAEILKVAQRSEGHWVLDVRVNSHFSTQVQTSTRAQELPRDQRGSGTGAMLFASAHLNLGSQTMDSCPSLEGKKLRLQWQEARGPKVGEKLSAIVRLKAPWGQSNPKAFSYERWLLASGYAATGYVKHVHQLGPVQDESLRHRWSHRIRWALEQQALVRPNVLQALVTGDGGMVEPEVWDLYRRSGAIHLLVISGLHVSVLAVMLLALMQYPLRLLGVWQQRDGATLLAALLVVIGAFCLAWFTGFGSPVMRVAVMLSVLLVLHWQQRRAGLWTVLALSLLLTTLMVPSQAFRSGFWLSYGAVAVLLWFYLSRRPGAAYLSGVIQAQGVLFVGLTPVTVQVLGEAALLAMPANYLAVPILTLITMPCLFLGLLALALTSNDSYLLDLIMKPVAQTLLRLADFSVVLIESLLDSLLNSVPLSSASLGYVSAPIAVAAMVSALIVLLPIRAYFRWGACCGLMMIGLQVAPNIDFGQFCVRVVDVGQGSAALVDTAQHRLLVDTGPGWGNNSLAASQILPTLRATGKHRLDGLLLSHTDRDHAGGLDFFRRYFVATPELGPQRCPHGETWQWDGVAFTVLQASGLSTQNDLSCTLLVQTQTPNGPLAAFLSGDISRLAEPQLLPHLPTDIALLLAPHHGSATSSSMPLVRQLSPTFVIYSAGKDSRYGHPHARVVRRYRWEGSRQLNTATSGAIQWCSSHPGDVTTQRDKDR